VIGRATRAHANANQPMGTDQTDAMTEVKLQTCLTLSGVSSFTPKPAGPPATCSKGGIPRWRVSPPNPAPNPPPNPAGRAGCPNSPPGCCPNPPACAPPNSPPSVVCTGLTRAQVTLFHPLIISYLYFARGCVHRMILHRGSRNSTGPM
jgi:hypothetical protein